MESIGDIRAGLAARLSTIQGLRGYATWPDQINTPCAIVGPPSGTYHRTFDEGVALTFPVTLLAAPVQVGYRRGQEALDPYISASGSQSIRQSVEAEPTLGGMCDYATVTGFDRYDAQSTAGDAEYWGVVINVEVMA